MSKQIQEDLKKIKSNVSNILENVNQTKFASEVNLSQSTLSKIKSGSANPSLELLLYLERKYNLSIDNLKNHILSSEELDALLHPETAAKRFFDERQELKKYIGNYCVYYFFNGDDSERQQYLDTSLDYGLICIHESDTLPANELEVHAIMGSRDKNALQKLKKELDQCPFDSLRAYFDNNVERKHNYKGSLVLSSDIPQCIILKLHRSHDYAQILLPRPSLANRDAYLGGLGTLNTLSRGHYSPCIQCIALSSVDLSEASAEEIAQYLFMGTPEIEQNQIVSLAELIDKLYRRNLLGEKELLSIMTSFIQQNMEFYLQDHSLKLHHTGAEDKRWYHMLKHYLKKDKNGREE